MASILYKQVVKDFLAKIDNGDLKVGDRLPPEVDYAAQLGVSRSTLRIAFSSLEANGFIKRRQRGGTEVIANRPAKNINVVGGQLYDMLNPDLDFHIFVSDIRSVRTNDVELLASHESNFPLWLELTTTGFSQPYKAANSYNNVYVPPYYSNLNMKVGKIYKSTLDEIEKQYTVLLGQIRQKISAVLCPSAVAKKLNQSQGDPIVVNTFEMEDSEGKTIVLGTSYFQTATMENQF